MKTRKWLILAGFLVLAGTLMFGIVMWKSQWNFEMLNTNKYETNIYDVKEEFHDVSVNTDTANVIFALSEDGKCRVECHEEEKAKHTVRVQNNTLAIDRVDKKVWYDYIGINFTTPQIIIYLSESEIGSLLICESTGEISLDGISASTIDISVTTGDVELKNIKCDGDVSIDASTGEVRAENVLCEKFVSDGSTGDLHLKNVIGKKKIFAKRGVGDIEFDKCDAKEIYAETDTGDVTGTFLSGKEFFANTDLGEVEIPESVSGGRCKITTDIGDIRIKVTE